MIDLVVKVLAAYLLGSVSGSMVVGAVRKVDIRRSGSGNAGGTNAFRTQGFRFALAVVIIDIGKGALAAGLLPLAPLGEPAAQASPLVQSLACGFAAVVGHCFPLFYGFRGGKGAGTAVGALSVIQPLALLPMVAAWLLSLTLTGWVGLSTMLAAVALVPSLLWLNVPQATLWFGIALAAFILFMHRSNIRNMLNGTEHRFERARAAHWLRRDR